MIMNLVEYVCTCVPCNNRVLNADAGVTQTVWTPATIRDLGTFATAGVSAASVADPSHFGSPQIRASD
jgi:hypothetical protein